MVFGGSNDDLGLVRDLSGLGFVNGMGCIEKIRRRTPVQQWTTGRVGNQVAHLSSNVIFGDFDGAVVVSGRNSYRRTIATLWSTICCSSLLELLAERFGQYVIRR